MHTYSWRTRLTGAFRGIPTPRQYTSPLLGVQMQLEGHCALDTTTCDTINIAVNTAVILQFRCILQISDHCTSTRCWSVDSHIFIVEGAPRKNNRKAIDHAHSTIYTYAKKEEYRKDGCAICKCCSMLPGPPLRCRRPDSRPRETTR